MTARRRQTHRLPGRSPAPVAPDLVRVGDLFITSGIRGVDNGGALGATPPEQFRLAWGNLRRLLDHAGISAADVALVTSFIDQRGYRSSIDPGWLELFPDAADRPARKTTCCPLPPGESVQLQAFGVIGGNRRPIEVPGLSHKGPLPNGVRIGDYVFSSVIVAQDRTTSQEPEGARAQTEACFDNLRAFLQAAGGDVEDVTLQWVYLSDWRHQPDMVDAYVRSWPVGGYQPARKTFHYEMASQIQMQVIGRIGGSRRNLEIAGVGHHDPIPLGAMTGELLCSSGIRGGDPSGENSLSVAATASAQARRGLDNVASLMQAAGGTVDDIGHLTVLVQDHADVPAVDAALEAMFPDPEDRPARQILKLGVKHRARVQLHLTAVVPLERRPGRRSRA